MSSDTAAIPAITLRISKSLCCGQSALNNSEFRHTFLCSRRNDPVGWNVNGEYALNLTPHRSSPTAPRANWKSDLRLPSCLAQSWFPGRHLSGKKFVFAKVNSETRLSASSQNTDVAGPLNAFPSAAPNQKVCSQGTRLFPYQKISCA